MNFPAETATTEHPQTGPRRRWYQFRLSTVLVLVAICAWAMALRPWMEWEAASFPGAADRQNIGFEIQWHGLKTALPDLDNTVQVSLYITLGMPPVVHELYGSGGPRQLFYPALAFLTFVTWKWTWPRVARLRAAPLESVPRT